MIISAIFQYIRILLVVSYCLGSISISINIGIIFYENNNNWNNNT